MTWESAGTIAEITGAIAVVVSLFYLAVQVRQNTKIVAANTIQSISSTASDISMRVAESPHLSRIFVKLIADTEELSLEEAMQMQLVMRAGVRNFENYYYQYQRGYLEEDMWVGYKRAVLDQLSLSFGKSWWNNHRVVFGERFVEFVESELEGIRPNENAYAKTQSSGKRESDA